MKKILCVLAIAVLFSAVSFAKEKTFTKEATEVVPPSQSQDQVIAYLTQKLTREATEEAGTFITSELNIKNYEITKDEFSSFAGAISKVKVENKETFTKNNQQYVKVKLNVTVDTDNVKTYLEKIMQDNEYKKEAEELRQKNLELEKQLKTATKQQYEKELSSQVKQQVALQKKQELEIEKLTLKAKEEFAKAKEEQDKKTAEREKEILKLKEQIAQEQNNIKKAELENQARIKELENKAKNELKNYSAKTKTMTIQQAIEEVKELRKKISEITTNFETLVRTNRNNLIKSYDEQYKLSASTNSKDKWETTEQYKERLNKNEKIKNKLELEKADNIFQYNKKTLQSMIETLEPFEKKLEETQKGSYFDKSRKKASIESMGDIYADEGYFSIKVKFKDITKTLGFIFNKPGIGLEKAKLIYQTPKQFVIEPFFFVDKNLKPTFKGFYGKHLGTGIEKNWDFFEGKKIERIESFDEIKNIERYKQLNELLKKIELFGEENIPKETLNKVKSADILDINSCQKISDECKKIDNLVIERKRKMVGKIYADGQMTFGIKLNDYGQVLSCGECEACNKYSIADWYNIVDIKTNDNSIDYFVAGLKRDGSIVYYYSYTKKDYSNTRYSGTGTIEEKDIVAIDLSYTHHIVWMKKDGTVMASGNNFDGQCNIGNWKDIVQIIAGYNNTVGLTKDGTVIAVGSNLYGIEKAVTNWKNIKKIYKNNLGTTVIGLKKDGTVIAAGNNKYGQCDVTGWTNIVDISFGTGHTVGLKKDGTVVACGENDFGQCNVKDWKDIVKIYAGSLHTVGLKKDGTVVSCGYGGKSGKEYDLSKWADIVDISIGQAIVGLKKDGTVVAAVDRAFNYKTADVEDWGK
ncbi:MAG: hypothetical protein K5622_00030 [Endomicrobiaceae bacterium]|nr:hypothetical protein [Endomicrobiaceae bacterium]